MRAPVANPERVVIAGRRSVGQVEVTHRHHAAVVSDEKLVNDRSNNEVGRGAGPQGGRRVHGAPNRRFRHVAPAVTP